MQRRQLLFAALGLFGSWHALAHAYPDAGKEASDLDARSLAESAARRERHGRLFIIGGYEDRAEDKLILRRFVDLQHRADPQIAVLTAASTYSNYVWRRYDRILADLGVRRRVHVAVASREDCEAPEPALQILQSDGILITGGDQRRLLSLIGGTRIERAIQQAYREHGACVAGTSAGAAAMSKLMLAAGTITDGMGLLHGAIVDQHFSERRRLSRLLAAVARNPQLIGIGVDENTALVIERGLSFEVVGAGAVTVVDGRALSDPLAGAGPAQLMRMAEVRIHRLPPGSSYRLDDDRFMLPAGGGAQPAEQPALPTLKDVLPILTQA